MLSYKLAIPQKKWCQKATGSCFQTHKQEEKPKLPRTRQLKNLAWLSQKKSTDIIIGFGHALVFTLQKFILHSLASYKYHFIYCLARTVEYRPSRTQLCSRENENCFTLTYGALLVMRHQCIEVVKQDNVAVASKSTFTLSGGGGGGLRSM
jgi:hypothetical protein